MSVLKWFGMLMRYVVRYPYITEGSYEHHLIERMYEDLERDLPANYDNCDRGAALFHIPRLFLIREREHLAGWSIWFIVFSLGVCSIILLLILLFGYWVITQIFLVGYVIYAIALSGASIYVIFNVDYWLSNSHRLSALFRTPFRSFLTCLGFSMIVALMIVSLMQLVQITNSLFLSTTLGVILGTWLLLALVVSARLVWGFYVLVVAAREKRRDKEINATTKYRIWTVFLLRSTEDIRALYSAADFIYARVCVRLIMKRTNDK